MCRNLVHELGRSPPTSANRLFDVATNFASGEEAVGAIFDGKATKRKEDSPAEGSSKTKTPAKKLKRGKKGKKQAPQNQCGQGQWEDSNEAFVASPDCKGPQGPPRVGGGLFDDMFKKSCPYHKGSVNHTLE